ncbi:MAG: diguanylate cyclase [Thalassotalea sp.]|nr:diguanylate cyclase [Thalassotalea sp.]
MVQVRTAQRKTRSNIHDIQINKPILIIEDQVSLSKMLKELLVKRFDSDVHIANSYADAKVLLSKHRHEYHVVICDLNLPDAPNGEIVDLVNRAKVKMIALTGTFGEKMREKMINKGVIDYITKDSVNAYEYVVNLVGRLYENYSTKLLIVEDSLIARKLVQHMLELQNFNVLLAGNGKEALTVLEENPDIKLVLTDYNMPEMNGFDLTLDLRKHHLKEQLAVIGLSATGNNELGAQFIKNGANDFLTKPVSYEELLCRINQNIDMLFYMEALRNAAHRDFLTNLYNRRYFFNEGKVLYEKSIQNHQPVAVAMLDIDHFKQVNDNYGHEVGDDLLVYFSYELSKQFDQHIVARLGGEEFVVLFTNVESEQAFDLMDKFRQKIADASIKTDGETISMSVSIGLHHIAGESLDAMLKLADENLYRAKNNGRNRVVSS